MSQKIEIELTDEQADLVTKIARVRGESPVETADIMFRHGASAFTEESISDMAAGRTEYHIEPEFERPI